MSKKLAPLMVDSRVAADALQIDHDLFLTLVHSGRIPSGIQLGPETRWYIDDLRDLKRGEPAKERAKFRVAM